MNATSTVLLDKRNKVEKLVGHFRAMGFLVLVLGGGSVAVTLSSLDTASMGTASIIGKGVVTFAPNLAIWIVLRWVADVLDFLVELSKRD